MTLPLVGYGGRSGRRWRWRERSWKRMRNAVPVPTLRSDGHPRHRKVPGQCPNTARLAFLQTGRGFTNHGWRLKALRGQSTVGRWSLSFSWTCAIRLGVAQNEIRASYKIKPTSAKCPSLSVRCHSLCHPLQQQECVNQADVSVCVRHVTHFPTISRCAEDDGCYTFNGI